MLEILQLISTLSFFFVYYYYGIYLASLVVSVLSLAQFLLCAFARLPSTTMSQSNLLLLSVFGFATWFFNNPLFIQWKISIINLGFALFLSIYRHMKNEAFFTTTFRSSRLLIPDVVGRQADNALVLFFLVVSVVNYWIFTNYSEAVWVNFKTALLFVNIIYLALITAYISKHMQPISDPV